MHRQTPRPHSYYSGPFLPTSKHGCGMYFRQEPVARPPARSPPPALRRGVSGLSLSHLAGDQASLPTCGPLRPPPASFPTPSSCIGPHGFGPAHAVCQFCTGGGGAQPSVCTAPSGLISPRPRQACPCSRISIPFPGGSGHGYMSMCGWSACRRGHPRRTHPSHSFTTFRARPSGAGHFISLSLEPQHFLAPQDSRLHDQAEPYMYVPAGSHDVAVLAKPRFSSSSSPGSGLARRSSRGTAHIVTRTTTQSRLSFGPRHGDSSVSPFRKGALWQLAREARHLAESAGGCCRPCCRSLPAALAFLASVSVSGRRVAVKSAPALFRAGTGTCRGATCGRKGNQGCCSQHD